MAHLNGVDTRTIGNVTSTTPSRQMAGDKIDLREEFDGIMMGSDRLTAKGHYVTLVHQYLDQPTSDWDPINKAAIGDHPFETNEQFVLCRRARPWLTPYNEQVINMGLDLRDTYIYYFRYDVEVGYHDFIYEHGYVEGQTNVDTDDINTKTERYNVKFIEPKRADQGRIEYYVVIGELDESHRS